MSTEPERWIPQDVPDEAWFSVRQVLRHGLTTYEEQITIWKAPTFEEAARRAREEGELTADTLNAELLPLVQICRLSEYPADGAEVFSLMRDSDLSSDEYLDTFFTTGDEREGTLDT